MAKLEGFRLVNIHANHNTIIYPNEYFNIEGKNVLIDMKNGGGKTLAAQMLFQTILPNSYFTDKNPLINLFSGVPSGSTIHCVSHFSIEGHQFNNLYLGFAAMAEPKNNDELSNMPDKADLGLKFMNFIIMGNNLAADSLSIDTLPLSQIDGDAIIPKSYKELKDFLESKKKNSKHERFYYIEVFENEKSKFSQKLKEFGINSEVFEFLREINKDENYIKQFFEDKCKKPRDLLMNFIIPNTEKALDARAFTMKLDKVDRSSQLAESLFEKSQSLNELNKFQADKAEYEKLKSEIGNFVAFAKSKEDVLESYDLHLKEYPKQVAAYILAIRETEEVIRKLKAQSTEWESQKEQLQKELENIDIRELQLKLEDLQRIFDIKDEKIKRTNAEIKELTCQKDKMEAINLTVDYKRFEAARIGIDEMLEKLTNINYNEKKTTAELANTICKIADAAIINFTEEQRLNEVQQKNEKERNSDIKVREGELRTKLQYNKAENEQYEAQKDNLEKALSDVRKELGKYPILSGLFIDEEELKEIERLQMKIANDIENIEENINFNLEEKYTAKNQIEITSSTLKERNNKLLETKQWLQEYQDSLEIVKLKVGAEEDNIENIRIQIKQQIAATAKKIDEFQRRITELEGEISILQDYGFLRSKSKYDALNTLKVDWQYAEFGSDILKALDKERVDTILQRFPGFSEVLVVSDADYQQVANGKKTVNVAIAKENFILMPRSAIYKIDKDCLFEQLFLITRDGEYYRSLLNSKEAVVLREKDIEKNRKTCTVLEEEKTVNERQLELLDKHLHQYPNELIQKKYNEANRLDSEIKSLNALRLQYEQQFKTLELKEDELKASKRKYLSNKELVEAKKELLLKKIDMDSKHKDVIECLRRLQDERVQLEYDYESNKSDFKTSEKEIDRIEKVIERINQNLQQYKKYLDEAGGYKDSQFELLNEVDITNLFKRFEVAKSDFDEKVQNYDKLVKEQNELNNQMQDIKSSHYFKKFSFKEIYDSNYIEKIKSSEFESINNKLYQLDLVKPEHEKEKNMAESNLITGKRDYDKEKHKITVYFSRFAELGQQELNDLKEINITQLEKLTALLNNNKEMSDKANMGHNDLEKEMFKFRVFCETQGLDWKNATQSTEKKPYDLMYQSLEKLKVEYDRALKKINDEIKKLESILKNLSINEQVKVRLKDQLVTKRFYNEVLKLVALLEQTSDSITLTIRNLETSIENIGRLDEEIASQVYRMLKTILDEVAKIPEYSRFKYDDYTRDSFRINLNDENSCRIDNDIALSRIKAHIYDLAYSVQNKGMTKKEIKNKLCINNIIHFAIDFDKLSIQILKIEQDKPKYYTWGRLSASSGQSYVTYVMFAITMIKYFNNVTLISDKMKAPIFVFLDNPFASASAIELWEPVRRFLDKSNAQLLCVAHNVPSSAQILFDKHMIIEQTKNSKGQFINTMRNEKTEAKEILQMGLFEHFAIE